MDKKRVYISGPMEGYPEYNFPAFDKAEELLTKQGYVVVNPANLSRELLKQKPNATRGDFLIQDIKHLLECDYIFLLEGWEKSLGARLELHVALGCGVEKL